MPLAPAYDWTELLVAFDDFMDAATFAQDVANEDGILIKLATHRGADRQSYFQRVAPCRGGHQPRHPAGRAALLRGAEDLHEGATTTPEMIIYNSADNDWPKTPGALANTPGTTRRCAR
jgi:hypothetical protein